MSLLTAEVSTPVGPFYMIIKGKIVIRAVFGNPESPSDIKPHPYTKLITAYFDGDKNALSEIPYLQTSTDFTEKIWKEISKIPYGKTSNYAQLAEKIDNAKAVRAVGSACGKNNIVLIVPCHRVIKSDGNIGKYSGGLHIKEYLLKHEGVKI